MADRMFSLDCHVCGSSMFCRDEDLFSDGEQEPCEECGTIHWISVDDEQAYTRTDEHVEDIGQPRCDNSCGLILMSSPALVKEFLGSPCKWDCEKTKAWRAAGEPKITKL